METSVSFVGLTSMAMNLKGVPRFMDGMVSKTYTKPLMNRLWAVYVENLHGPRRPVNYPGPVPATLPVGIRTGRLIGGATKAQINARSFQVYNTAGHAKYLEFGTPKMAARRPLGAAVDEVGQEVPGNMGQVMANLVEFCRN
jgi:hypothetical protein